jgi:hypothetical protein
MDVKLLEEDAQFDARTSHSSLAGPCCKVDAHGTCSPQDVVERHEASEITAQDGKHDAREDALTVILSRCEEGRARFDEKAKSRHCHNNGLHAE